MKQIPQIDANTYNGNPMRTFSFFMRQMASEAILKTFYQAAGVYLNQFTNAILILNFFFQCHYTFIPAFTCKFVRAKWIFTLIFLT